MADKEDDVVGGIIYADPKECQELVERTGIDTLAPALGSVHGPYKGEPKLGFKEMEEIGASTGLPLVLHGGTGIPTKDIQKQSLMVLLKLMLILKTKLLQLKQ